MAKKRASRVSKTSKSQKASSTDEGPKAETTSLDVARVTTPVRQVQAEFNIHDPAAIDRLRGMQAHLADVASRRRTNPRPSHLVSAAAVQHRNLPFPHFLQQWLADVYGYAETGVVQFIGDPGCGKTTKVLSDVGFIMHTRNAQALYIACEGRDKMMSRDRMLRCMHHDPQIALTLLKSLSVEYAQTVLQLPHKIKTWAEAQREGFVVPGTKRKVAGLPMDIPLLVVVDPFSRLLSPVEAEGFVVDWDKLAAEKDHQHGEGGNMGHAKFAHDFSRKLQAVCDNLGILLFIIHQRTEDIDFGKKGSGEYNIPAWRKRLTSYNYLGGNALDGIASQVLVMTSTELAWDKVLERSTGRRVRVRMCKQSHGAGERYAQWELRMSHTRDRPDFLEPAIIYSEGFCRMLADNKLLGASISDKGLVSIADLGYVGLTFEQADNLLHANPQVLSKLGHDLRISGYFQLVDEIMKNTAVTVANAESR